MTQSYRPSEETRAPDDARARFVDAEERDEARRALTAAAALVVEVNVGAAARGRLGDVIDDAIERELEARGAAAPGIGATSDADAALSDQLFRARRVGASGIALSLGPLRPATSPLGALEPEDGATLRFWARSTNDRPVCILLDARDRETGAYVQPAPLRSVIASALEPEPIEEVPEPTPTEALALTTLAAMRADVVDPTTIEDVSVAGAPTTPEPTTGGPDEDVAEQASASDSFVAAMEPDAAAASVEPARGFVAPEPESVDWHPWLHALLSARGPQPLSAFERLFAQAYMPLLGAIGEGLDDPHALHAVEEFRHTFARAYSEACPMFALTGKRPRMVLDSFDVAAKIARLHGARSTQLLLVDAMRYDLGLEVRDVVRAAMGPRASFTDDLVLWSALPSTTSRQLETLTRGVDALRSDPSAEREGESLRGRTADVIRRVKVGSRDVYKLDSVEARIREDARPSGFEGIARAAGEAITRHALSLKPRTLLLVFGDHGFAVDRDGRPRHGGASPEEVLVGAFALLTGETH